MKRLKSWGSSKSSAKAEAAAKLANQPPSAQWPTVSTVSEEQPSRLGSQPQTQSSHVPSDTHVNFSDEEIRAMEESALEYAIQQSQQQTDRYVAFHPMLVHLLPLLHTAKRQMPICGIACNAVICCLSCHIRLCMQCSERECKCLLSLQAHLRPHQISILAEGSHVLISLLPCALQST